MSDNYAVGRFVAHVDSPTADLLLTSIVHAEMQQKLGQKRAEGRGGWHLEDRLDYTELEDMLLKHVEAYHKNADASQLIDIINLAGMLMVRRMLYDDVPE